MTKRAKSAGHDFISRNVFLTHLSNLTLQNWCFRSIFGQVPHVRVNCTPILLYRTTGMIFSQSAGHNYISRLIMSSLLIFVSHATFELHCKTTHCKTGNLLENKIKVNPSQEMVFQNILKSHKVKIGVFRFLAQRFTFLLKSVYGLVCSNCCPDFMFFGDFEPY